LGLERRDDLVHRGAVEGVHGVGAGGGVIQHQRHDAVGDRLVPDRALRGGADGSLLWLERSRVRYEARTRTTRVAMPRLPPTHSVARPRRRSRRSSSSTSVPRIIAPVAPSGWPIAVAPPLTLVISSVMPMSRMNRMATAANASL